MNLIEKLDNQKLIVEKIIDLIPSSTFMVKKTVKT